jgi:hypothetical protein
VIKIIPAKEAEEMDQAFEDYLQFIETVSSDKI